MRPTAKPRAAPRNTAPRPRLVVAYESSSEEEAAPLSPVPVEDTFGDTHDDEAPLAPVPAPPIVPPVPVEFPRPVAVVAPPEAGEGTPAAEGGPQKKVLRDYLAELGRERKRKRAPRKTKSEAGDVEPEKEAEAPAPAAPAPSAAPTTVQFVRGPDGRLQLDTSTLVQTAVSQDLDEEALVEAEGYEPKSAYSKRHPGQKWTIEDTVKFYDALRTCGLDFTLIEAIFPNREPRHVC
jgi:Myb DNA-binding like